MSLGYGIGSLSCMNSKWDKKYYYFEFFDSHGKKFEPVFGNRDECEAGRLKLSKNEYPAQVCGCENSVDKVGTYLQGIILHKDSLICYNFDKDAKGTKVVIKDYKDDTVANNVVLKDYSHLDLCEEGLNNYLKSAESMQSPKANTIQAAPSIK